MTDYESARAQKLALEAEMDLASKALKDCNPNNERGPMGLTPDHIKNTPEWKAAYTAFEKAKKKVQIYNRVFLKVYKKEWRAEVMAKRGIKN